MDLKKTYRKFKNKRSKSSKKSKTSKSRKLSRSKSGKLKILPPLDKSNLHLSDYGYSLANKDAERKRSLKRASKKEGSLPVLRRLNLIRNYTADPSNKKKMTKDVEFLKSKYKKEKSLKRSKK